MSMEQRLTPELETRIKEKIKETVNKINEHFKMDMPIPPVYYDVTGTTAGLAKYYSMSVHLNPTLLLQNIEDSINVTVPHEVCHLTNFYLHKKEKKLGSPKAHGAQWKLMMWVVGASAKVTHNYDVEDVKPQKIEYLYQCGCSVGVKVSTTIHNRIKKGYRYACKKCNKALHSGERVMNIGFSRPSPHGTTKVREE